MVPRFLEGKYNIWIVAVIVSLWKVFLALAYARVHHPNYFVNLFYYADIFGNAFSGGHPYVTISARVGRYGAMYVDQTKSIKRSLWIFCENRINSAFKPVDGDDHCHQAMVETVTVIKNEEGLPIHIQQGPVGWMVVLLPIVVIMCFLLKPFIWFMHAIGLMKKNVRFDPVEWKKQQSLMRM